jgi:seryl-tRNA synthetase
MLQVNFIKENTELVLTGLKKKHFKTAEEDVREVMAWDTKRKKLQFELDNTLSQSKILAGSIGQLLKEGKKEEAELKKAETAQLKITAKSLEDQLAEAEVSLQEILVKIPNVPHISVPEGRLPEDNVEVYSFGEKKTLPAGSLPHWDLIKKYDIIDFDLGNKITGAGFPVYKNKGARLQRALINFFLDEATKAGFTEIQPPILINAESGFATGQLPDKDGQMYYATEDKLYLIPTAEVPITNIYRDTILKAEDLPIKNAGYTPCFRREAGSWGAHVRGLNRLHQFDKVEIVQIETPERSYTALEEMKDHVKGLMEKLGLTYRIIKLCGGDMSFTSALTYDFEAWSGAQERWLEVSSVSNFETYQSNRLKLRYKNAEGKMQLLHTLNGSALALPRIVACILENNQTADGINIPEVLIPYTGFAKI